MFKKFIGVIVILGAGYFLVSYFSLFSTKQDISKHESPNHTYKKSTESGKITYADKIKSVSKINRKKMQDTKGKSMYMPFGVKTDEENNRYIPRKDIPVASEFTVDLQQFRKMRSGDHFILPQINGEILEGVVTTAKKGLGESVRIFAHIEGEGDRSFIQITIGKKSAYYTVQSSGGKYTGKSVGTIGYFYHSDAIINAVAVKRKPGSVDYLRPPVDVKN